MNKHTATLLEQHFDTAFNAPDGLKKLRELILTLAMQGKLVPQNPNDPPASALLKEIEAEKKRLVKEGKIKAPKPLPPVTENEKPYALPQGWEWVRFPYCYYGIGSKSNQIQTSGYQESGTYPVIDQGKTFIAAYTDVKDLLLKLNKPVIVFGDHTKNIKYVDFDFVIGADGVKTLSPYDRIAPKFLFRLMQSYNLADRGYARHFGVLNEKLAPLPPTPEQHRIVAKIDELMARCDALEKLRTAQNEKRLSVHAAAIQQLLNMAEPVQHQRAQAFLADHFGDLYTVKENVAELRKAILQLAVMGKLVPQNPNDPPASELLKEIEAEKKRLVKEGKIKAPKPLPPVTEEEKPYALPQGWEWVRFGCITINRDGERVPVSSGERQKMKGVYDYYGASGVIDKVSSFIFDKSLLLIGEDGANLINRSTPIAFIAHGMYWVNNHAHVIDVSHPNLLLWLECFINAIDLKPYVTGSAQPKMNQAKMNSICVALPPLPEQTRIVAKIDELMALCDSLNMQIDAATAKQAELLHALMAHV